jgi:hypothetical protein
METLLCPSMRFRISSPVDSTCDSIDIATSYLGNIETVFYQKARELFI